MLEVMHHGDIKLVRVTGLPLTHVSKQDGPIIVGLGEQTGHRHIVGAATVYAAPGITMQDLAQFAATGQPIEGDVYLQVDAPTIIKHDKDGRRTGEHTDITLPPGYWIVSRPREYAPDEIRRVWD